MRVKISTNIYVLAKNPSLKEIRGPIEIPEEYWKYLSDDERLYIAFLNTKIPKKASHFTRWYYLTNEDVNSDGTFNWKVLIKNLIKFGQSEKKSQDLNDKINGYGIVFSMLLMIIFIIFVIYTAITI